LDKPAVAAIVVNWNQKELLVEAVQSLLNSDWGNLVVLVVDNGSQDGSFNEITRRFPSVKLLGNDSNLGFAAGNNQGIQWALRAGVEYLFFLNNDATIESDTITRLVAEIERNSKYAAVAPYIFYTQPKDMIWFGGGEVKLWRGRIAHRHLREKFRASDHQPTVTDYLTGCCFLARTSAMVAANGFDVGYVFYSEDVDLCLRLRSAGWLLGVTPEAKVYHRVSASAMGAWSPFKAYHRARSSMILFRRFARWWEWPTLIVGSLIAAMIITAKLVVEGKSDTASALWSGAISGILDGEIPDRFQLRKR